MPSPTSRIEPTSSISRSRAYSSISLRRTDAISSALIFISLLVLETARSQLLTDCLEARAERRVVDVVPRAHHETPDESGIDPLLENHFAVARGLVALLQRVLDAVPLIVVERLGARDLHHELALALVIRSDERLD